jgi:hypothetical protein
MRRWPPTHVYVCVAPRGQVKIGASVDPNVRIKSIDGFFGYPLVLVKFWHRPDDALDVETTTKKLLRKYRIMPHEEWFSCCVEQAVEAVEGAIHLLDARDFRLLRYNRRKALGFKNRKLWFGEAYRLPTIDDMDTE